MRKSRFLKRGILALVVLALVAAACGDDDDPNAAPENDDGQTIIRQTSLGLANEIVTAWAIEKGIFADHDLDVQLVRVAGGSASLAAVVGGSADLGFTNWMTGIIAYNNGFPIQFVINAYENPQPTGPNAGGVVASAGSGITSAAELCGHKVATNELGGIGQIYLSGFARAAGCNPEDINFLAIPFPQLAEAVISGRVDACQCTAGQVAQILAEGGVFLGDPFDEVSGGRMNFAGYLANNDWIAANEDVLERYREAMDESLAQVNDPANLAEVTRVKSEFSGIPEGVFAGILENKLVNSTDLAVLQAQAQLLVDEGYLREAPDVSGLLYTTAR